MGIGVDVIEELPTVVVADVGVVDFRTALMRIPVGNANIGRNGGGGSFGLYRA